MKSKLSDKQQAFCKHWLRCGFNATKAAKLAGYAEKTAYSTGHELLKKPEIQAEISRLRKKIEETTGISKEMVVISHLTFAQDENQRTCDRQRSLEAIAKLMGYNEAEKHKVEVDEQKIHISIDGKPVTLTK